MKKLLSILALALCFVACQNEPEVNVSNSDLVDVVLNIEAPELGITRAGQDGQDDSKNAKDSAYGAIDYADAAFWAENDLRYILEVYAEGDSDGSEGPIAKERLVNCLDKYAPTEFKLRLVPNRTYKFVVFADFVAEGSSELSNPLEIADVYYDTEKLTAITSLQWNAMNEARDAYFITENVHVTTGLTKKLILTRPFAKVRVVTTDILDLEKYATPAKVVVTYYNHPIYKSFNAVNGAISEPMEGDELTHVVKYDGQYDAGYDSEDSGCMTLFADYIHAIADQQSNINFRMDVYDQNGRLLKSNDFSTEIPVQRNHLTTLIGNVLTTEATVQILISDEFVGNYKETVPDRKFDNDTIIVTGFENGGTYANGAYSYKVSNANTGESFTLNIKDSALTYGTLAEGEYEFGTHFTATNVMVNMPLTRAAVAAKAEGGKMVVDIDENNKYTIAIDLVVKDAANNAIYPSFGYYGDFAIEAVEALATPANFVGTVEGEKVTFTWTAVENATSYDVVFNGITATISEGTTATFTVQATDEKQTLTASIVAKADDYKTSDAATCEVVIPAKAVESEPVAIATPKVTASVKVNVVTLTWEEVEGASHYTVQVNDDVEKVVNETTYIFEGDYEVKYTFTVKAIAADTVKNLDSEATVVTATTEAKPADVPAAGSELTVKEFLTLANLENEYVLTGKITRVVSDYYGNFDLTDETGTIYIYGLLTPEGAERTQWAAAGLHEGDTITIKGKYSLYNDDPQISKAVYVSHVPAPFVSAEAITVNSTDTTAAIEVLSNINWMVSCDATWVTSYTESGSNNGTINVTLDANTSTENRTATFTLTGEGIEKYVVTLTQYGAGASDTKGTYTSEAFIKENSASGNNKFYFEKVNIAGTTYDCLKLGTGSVVGKYTSNAVNESGDLTLSFYALGWNGKTSKLNVYLDGNKVGETLTLTPNSGVANNSPYTVTPSDDTDYYTLTLTGVTEASTITFETVSGATRTIIFGVQLY